MVEHRGKVSVAQRPASLHKNAVAVANARGPGRPDEVLLHVYNLLKLKRVRPGGRQELGGARLETASSRRCGGCFASVLSSFLRVWKIVLSFGGLPLRGSFPPADSRSGWVSHGILRCGCRV